MWLIIAIISISVIALITWLVNGISGKRICPICAGVFGTWLWMLIGRSAGLGVDNILLAILMGGSIVGITYQLEKRIDKKKNIILFKFLFILIGFLLVYGVISAQWIYSAILFAAELSIFFIFTAQLAQKDLPDEEEKKIKELEEKMKNCC